MVAILTPNNKSDLRLLNDVLEQFGIPSKILSREKMEDTGLAMLMKSIDSTKKVSRSEIMKRLKS